MDTGSLWSDSGSDNSDIEVLEEARPREPATQPPIICRQHQPSAVVMDAHEGCERLQISHTVKRETGDYISVNYFYKVVSSSFMNDDIFLIKKESNGRVVDTQIDLIREISRYCIIDDAIREECDIACMICLDTFLPSDKIFILNSRINKCQNTIFCEECVNHQIARCPQCATPCNGHSLNAPLMSVLSKVSIHKDDFQKHNQSSHQILDFSCLIKIHVRCVFNDCTWTGMRSTLFDHVKHCGHRKIICDKAIDGGRCEKIVKIRDLVEHRLDEMKECIKHQNVCPECREEMWGDGHEVSTDCSLLAFRRNFTGDESVKVLQRFIQDEFSDFRKAALIDFLGKYLNNKKLCILIF
jgi:hypothetical protein